jgi:hypothetical protein
LSCPRRGLDLRLQQNKNALQKTSQAEDLEKEKTKHGRAKIKVAWRVRSLMERFGRRNVLLLD